MAEKMRRCGRRRARLVVLGLALSLCATACVTTVDTIKEMEPGLANPPGLSPSPVWQSVITARTADIMELLDSGRLLVGTLKLKPVLGAARKLVPGELLLLDANSGAVIWSVPRSAFSPLERQVLLATEPLLLIGSYKGSSFGSVHAIDPGTGSVVWQAKVGVTRPLVIFETGLCVISGPDPKLPELKALRIKDGSEAWRVSLPGHAPPKAEPARLKQLDAGILVEATESSLLDPVSGRLRWRADFGEAPSFVSETGEGRLLIGAGSRLVSRAEGDGEETWSWLDPEGALLASATLEGPRVLVLSLAPSPVAAAPKTCFVSALDPQDGRCLWRKAFPQVPRSAIFADGSLLCFATDDRLVLLDAEKGEVKSRPRLPDFLLVPSRVTDILVPLKDGVAVLRESGIAQYSADGNPGYQVCFKGSTRYGSDFAWKQYEEALLAEAPIAGQAPLRSMLARQGPRPTLYSQAADYQKYVYQSTASTLRYGSSASSSERMSALDRREMAARNSLSMGQAEANIRFFMAGAQFGAALGQALAVGVGMAVTDATSSLMELRSFQAMESGSLLARGFAGNLIVRPEYEDGWRLRVVDLASGGDAILPLSPPNESLRNAEAPSLCVFAVDRENSRLFALGLGYDASKYRSYSVIHSRTDPGSGNRNLVLPYPSIMRFDLPRDGFRKAAAAPVLSGFHEPSPGELELVEAAIADDTERLEALLSSGVPVDASDRYGKTALMHAAEISNPGAIKLLFKWGADMWLRDCQDWTAYDYMMFPLMRPTTTINESIPAFSAEKARRRKM